MLSNNVVCNSNDGMSSIVNNNKNLYYNLSEIQNVNTSDTLLFLHFERTIYNMILGLKISLNGANSVKYSKN